jgi:hypothetical protein
MPYINLRFDNGAIRCEVDREIERQKYSDGLNCIDSEVFEATRVELEPGLTRIVGEKLIARSKLLHQNYTWEVLEDAQLNSESRRT